MSKPQLSREDTSAPSVLDNLTPLSRAEPLIYEFTDERAILHQYFRVREIMYRKVYKTDKFMGEQDVYDKIGHILIARRGQLSIGGCRLIIREADEDFLLPMEGPEFKLRDVFPNLPLRGLRHGEISRFAVMDDDGDKIEIMLALTKLIIEKCITSDLRYVFFKSPGLIMARNWRKIIHAHCGQKNIRICTEIKVPENPIYPDITWYVTVVTLPAAETDLCKKNGLARPVEAPVH